MMISHFSLDEGVDVLLVIGLLLRFEIIALDAKLRLGVFDALPGGGVERLVVDTAGVRHLAGFESRLGRLWFGSAFLQPGWAAEQE